MEFKMTNTYTYTARYAEHPEKIVTFTLYDDHLQVEIGAPLEQIAQVVANIDANGSDEEETEPGTEIIPTDQPKTWLKPIAVSLAQRATKPFRIIDVKAKMDDERLFVHAWVRLGGLRLFPISLVSGDIDNPDSAASFVAEIEKRKVDLRHKPAFLSIFDYWATWIAAISLVMGLFNHWRRKSLTEG
jgi:hypothetical protein